MQTRHVPNGRMDFTPRQSDFYHVNDRGVLITAPRGNGALDAFLSALLLNEGIPPSEHTAQPSDGDGEARLSGNRTGD